METTDNIGLRSEKIRHIIGRVPPFLLRSGIGIISAIVFLLLLAACFIPCPETITASVEVVHVYSGGKGEAHVLLPYGRFSEIKPGMKVEMQFEGYNVDTYGYTEGSINRVSRQVVTMPDGDYFVAGITFRQPELYSLVEKQKGIAVICLFEGSFLKRLISVSV